MSDSNRVGRSEAEPYRVARNHILALGYHDMRTLRWLLQQAIHGFQGVLGNME